MNNERWKESGRGHSPASFGELFAPSDRERQVGKAGPEPSPPVASKYPPQAVENKKIKSVSNRREYAGFSVGSRGTEIGKALG
jgi:hypothetical protein